MRGGKVGANPAEVTSRAGRASPATPRRLRGATQVPPDTRPHTCLPCQARDVPGNGARAAGLSSTAWRADAANPAREEPWGRRAQAAPKHSRGPDR